MSLVIEELKVAQFSTETPDSPPSHPQINAQSSLSGSSEEFVLPPPPEFLIPPPPVPNFVDPTICPEKMLTNSDLLHLSSYLIIGCILLLLFFTVAACSLRCCTKRHASDSDWQTERLLENAEEVEENLEDGENSEATAPNLCASCAAAASASKLDLKREEEEMCIKKRQQTPNRKSNVTLGYLKSQLSRLAASRKTGLTANRAANCGWPHHNNCTASTLTRTGNAAASSSSLPLSPLTLIDPESNSPIIRRTQQQIPSVSADLEREAGHRRSYYD